MPQEEIDISTKETTNNLHLRSSEVSEIISHEPGFLIRWGITIFCAVLIVVIIACWFVKYPDVVATKTVINGVNAPKDVRTKTDGKLIKLFVTENKLVVQNEIIGYIESRAKHATIIQLSNFLDTFSIVLQKQPELLAFNKIPVKQIESLGELQQAYQTFQQAAMSFKQYLFSGFYLQKKIMLQQDIVYLDKTYNNLLVQKKMQEEDLALQQETYNANEKMKSEKVISALDFRNEQSKLIGKKMGLPQINASIINIESSKHEKQKEIAELNNQIAQQKNIFNEALNTFKAQIADWEAKFLLKAPISGNIAFANFLQENVQLNSNQTVCFINPNNTKFYAEAYITQNNFGKLAVGQKVLLKFPAYPNEQFGFVEGSLAYISKIPTDSGYLAKISLPEKLITNYNKELQYHQGLRANGEIITQNMRLLERFFNQAKSIFKR